MTLRAPCALALALLPSIALAQTGLVKVTPIEVNQADCVAGSGNVAVLWTFTAGVGDTFRLVADSSCQNSAPAEGTTKTLGGDVGYAIKSASIPVATIKTAASADCASVNDTVVKICVYSIAGGGTGTSTLVDGADFTFQTALPPAPTGVSASPANAAIDVSYGPGTTGGANNADTASYAVEYAVATVDGGTPGFTRTGETTSTTLRVGNLTNGVTYVARVVPFSSAGNEGPASATVSATPDNFLDFWSSYKDAGGREAGGCGAGGAGALATLLLALAFFLRRRS